MDSKTLQVKKRNGRLQDLDINKANICAQRACEGLEDVSASEVVIDANVQLYNKIPTKEIDKALIRIKDDTYGYCLDTAEPIGLKRLMARPVAKYTIAAQEKHEKDEKVHADD